MIGCDIVDIAYTKQHSNWQRKGFLQKVFTESEQSLIHNSSNPFATVWRLWSMKETAYKANTHLSQTRSFNPSNLVCQLFDDGRGKVEIDGHTYSTVTIYSDEYIFTSSDIPNIKSSVFQIVHSKEQSQSKTCHNALIDQISQDKQWNKSQVTIQKSAFGLPFIIYKDQKQDIEISLSHHGRFGSYSLLYVS